MNVIEEEIVVEIADPSKTGAKGATVISVSLLNTNQLKFTMSDGRELITDLPVTPAYNVFAAGDFPVNAPNDSVLFKYTDGKLVDVVWRE